MLVLVAAAFLTLSLVNVQQVTQTFSANSLRSRITLREGSIKSESLRGTKLSFFANSTSSKKFQRALFELPDILDLLAVSLASGDSVYNSIRRVVARADGVIANELTYMIRAIELGGSFEEELSEVAKRLPQQQVAEFCNKLAMAMRRGTPLAKLLRDQAQSVRQEVHNQIAKQAGKNETRMMIPLVFLILPVTVLFAIYPSLQLLNIQTL
jgi:tight adherence protein C